MPVKIDIGGEMSLTFRCSQLIVNVAQSRLKTQDHHDLEAEYLDH